MSIALLILKIIAWILLGVVALVFVALFIPAVLDVRYVKKRLLVVAEFLFIKFTLFDSAKKKEPKKVQEAKNEIKEEAKAKVEEKPNKSKFDFEMLKKLLKPGAKAIWAIVKSLRIYDVRVVMVATGREYADVGIQAGASWAAIGGVMTLLRGVWKNIRYEELTVVPDYLGERGGEEKYSCKIAALPVIIVVSAMIFFIRYLKITAKSQASNEKETAQ